MKKYSKILAIILSSVAGISLIGCLGAYLLFKGSLPPLSGSFIVDSLENPVTIERDKNGIPSIYGSSRPDISEALGYVHAQDRFFQMDLLRRACAGELSELFGSKTLEIDKTRRVHQFRKRVQEVYANLEPSEKIILEKYSKGVNAGLASLSVRPFEYLLLFSEPKEWKPEDALLVCYALYFELQDPLAEINRGRGVMKKLLPEPVYNFFIHNGSAWQAALDSSVLPLLSIPSKESFAYLTTSAEIKQDERTPFHKGGSNQWAVQGNFTLDRSPLLACDMHLRLSVPNIWYRVGFNYPSSMGEQLSVHGATLPGAPFLIIGSNRHIAWGFTNACIDSSDLVLLEMDPNDPNKYKTPEGYKALDLETEIIQVKGQNPVEVTIKKSIWGPLDKEPFFGQPAALAWVAHQPGSLNLKFIELEQATSTKMALDTTKNARVPVLNFMVADKYGHIGWTLLGALLNRVGYDGSYPVSFADGTKQIKGLANPYNYPVIMDPSQKYLWTANNRSLGNEWKSLIGSTGFLNGIRAYQIQEKLEQLELANESRMLEIQMDNEVKFLDRWHRFLIDTLANAEPTPSRNQLKTVIENWDHHCRSDCPAYYWIRTFRNKTYDKIVARLLAPSLKEFPAFPLVYFDFEEPVWLIVKQQPDYLVDPAYKSWNEQFLATIDEMIDPKEIHEIEKQTWGTQAVLKLHHPLHDGVPYFKELLRMPYTQISGDYCVLRVHGARVGASQRMVVSPGKEENGIFQMPGGQSGHPLSPNFNDSHEDWVNGNPTPFLPGTTQHTLMLLPK